MRRYIWDFVPLVILTTIYVSLSTTGLNWDHIELSGGNGSDPDGGAMSEALRYVHDFSKNWNIGYKEYPQGYGFVLALLYKAVIPFASLFGILPAYEITSVHGGLYGQLPYPGFSVSSEAARVFFGITARAMSSLFGYLTVLLTYIIGRNFFQDRRIGFISALLLTSCYPFILFSQVSKYPATAIFFFLLSFYSTVQLAQRPSRGKYVLSGILAGAAISMIYYNVVAVLVLFLAHILVLSSESRLGLKSIFLDKKLLYALAACSATFLILNPRLFTHGFVLISQTINWSRTFGENRAGYLYLFDRYEGAGAFLYYMKDDVGLPLFVIILWGMLAAVIRIERKKSILLCAGVPYLLLSHFAREPYIVGTAYPIFFLLFAQSAVAYSYPSDQKHLQVSQRVKPLILITIVTGACIHGFFRCAAHNMINSQKSTSMQAQEWIHEHLPRGSHLILDGASVVKVGGRMGHIFRLNYVGGEPAITHDLRELIWPNGTEIFDAQYAVMGDGYFSEIVTEEKIDEYPILEEVLSPVGIGYGFREAHEAFTSLIDKHALLIKEIPEGQWSGENQRKIFFPLFPGVPFNSIVTFLVDSCFRSHGPSIKIFQLTPSFKQALEASLLTPTITCDCTHNKTTWGVFQEGALHLNTKSNEIELELCWQAGNRKVMRELVFVLDHSSTPKANSIERYLFRGTSRLRGKETVAVKRSKEFIGLEEDCYMTRAKIIVPKNMLSGEYVLRLNYASSQSGDFELGRFVLEN